MFHHHFICHIAACFDNLQPMKYVTRGINKGLSILKRNPVGQLVHMLVNEGLVCEH
jgi:hypothetical protein